MKPKLLKNYMDFSEWRGREFALYEEVDVPTEFPCYVYTVVKSWGMEESTPVYLYDSDLREMLGKMAEYRKSV